MKYMGMPLGMWALFAKSFRRQLTAVFGYDDAVARETLFVQPKGGEFVRGQRAKFLEGAFVQQQVDALTRRQLATLVLGINPLLTASQHCSGTLATHALQKFLCRSFHLQDSIRLNSTKFWILPSQTTRRSF